MTNHPSKAILLIVATLLLQLPAHAQQITRSKPQTIWGPISNGISVGIFKKEADWGSSHKDDLYFSMQLANMTTNFIWIWLPPIEFRYEIELWGPDGKQVRQLKPPFPASKARWSGLPPLSTNSTSASFDWFFLKETFDIRTNGQFTFAASVRINAYSNFALGQTQMYDKPAYYLLPQVTNSFHIYP